MPGEINNAYPHNAQPIEEMTDPYYEAVLELDQINKESRSDSLTCLPNKKSLTEFINIFDARPYSIIATYVDLKGFGEINRKIGHEAADEKIHEFSIFFKNKIRESDLLFHHHGDEFVLLSIKRDSPNTDISPEEGLKRHLEAINDSSEIKFEFNSVTFNSEKHKSLSDTVNQADLDLMKRKEAAKQQKSQQQSSQPL